MLDLFNLVNLYVVFILILLLTTVLVVYRYRHHPTIQRLWKQVPPEIKELRDIARNVSSDEDVSHEKELFDKAVQIAQETRSLIKSHPYIDEDRKRNLRASIDMTLNSMEKTLEQLKAVRRLSHSAGEKNKTELSRMDFSLQMRLERSCEVIEALPVNLMKIELSGSDRTVERLVDEMTEVNEQMLDLAKSHAAIKRLT